MFRQLLRAFAAILRTTVPAIICFIGVAVADDPKPRSPSSDLQRIAGIWSGAWGGGQNGDVVFQPVIAELVIHGDQIQMAGFRDASKIIGIFRIDSKAKRIQVTPAAKKEENQSATKSIVFDYELIGDNLTLNVGLCHVRR